MNRYNASEIRFSVGQQINSPIESWIGDFDATTQQFGCDKGLSKPMLTVENGLDLFRCHHRITCGRRLR